jgi:hypothetical protein
VRARATAVVVFLLAGALASGCKKSKEEEGGTKDMPPDPITRGEADMGRKACEAYVESVCDCALAVPALAEQCDLARAQPEALDMNLRSAMAQGNQTMEDRRALIANTRKIMRVCIEEQSKLATKGCPPETMHTGADEGGAGDGVKPAEAPAPSPDK